MQYVKMTGARPKTILGVEFKCHSLPHLRYEWRSNDGRFAIWQRTNRDSYHATIDGIGILSSETNKLKRFRSIENAMRAAVIRSLTPEAP